MSTPIIINPANTMKNAGNLANFAMKQGGGLYGGAYDAQLLQVWLTLWVNLKK